jgi:hypothetical protein
MPMAVIDLLDRPVVKAGRQHGDDHHDQQEQDDADAAENGRQDQKDDQRHKRAKHENVAMGEVDHADDAVNHRVADGDKPVDRTQSQPVQKLLKKILHAARPPWRNCCERTSPPCRLVERSQPCPLKLHVRVN